MASGTIQVANNPVNIQDNTIVAAITTKILSFILESDLIGLKVNPALSQNESEMY